MLRTVTVVLLVFACAEAGGAAHPTLRWAEGTPNCTVRAESDGHVYYGVSTDEFEITMAVDRKELEKIPHREIPMISAFVSMRHKQGQRITVMPTNITLEFIKHRHVTHQAIDPGLLVSNLQTEMDDVTYDIEHRQIRKHPELKEKKEAELQQRTADYTEMMGFVSAHALRPATLDQASESASGWVFFSTKDQWIGALRRPEQFILRVSLKDVVVEFPFQLPPKIGNVELRRRLGVNSDD